MLVWCSAGTNTIRLGTPYIVLGRLGVLTKGSWDVILVTIGIDVGTAGLLVVFITGVGADGLLVMLATDVGYKWGTNASVCKCWLEWATWGTVCSSRP